MLRNLLNLSVLCSRKHVLISYTVHKDSTPGFGPDICREPLMPQKTEAHYPSWFTSDGLCFGSDFPLKSFSLPERLHIPFLSSHCCALQNVCPSLFLCVGPRVFLGMCCNLNDGGSETAFVRSDSGGSVMCVPPAAQQSLLWRLVL